MCGEVNCFIRVADFFNIHREKNQFEHGHVKHWMSWLRVAYSYIDEILGNYTC
jgi:hypothetical protein